MNGDAWRTPCGQIGPEVDSTDDQVKVVIRVNGQLVPVWHWRRQCVRVPSRYEGARGGRG